ncbi:MAG: hypothetical protein ACKOPG_01845 [Novosphingobium sp.]
MPSAITLIKRGFQAMGCLVLLSIAALGGVSSYFDKHPEAQERLEVSARLAEPDSEMEAGLFTQVKAIVSHWWEAGEVVADQRAAKALAEKDRAEQRKEEQSRRFNDSSYNSGDDYYPEGN